MLCSLPRFTQNHAKKLKQEVNSVGKRNTEQHDTVDNILENHLDPQRPYLFYARKAM